MDRTADSITPRRSGWLWVPTLYFAEGLPYMVVMTVSAIMYKRFGLSNAELAFYCSLLSLPWVIKPFWSPLVDIYSSKRRWIIAMQVLMAAAFAAVAVALPGHAWFKASAASFMAVAFFSSTHDIAADGFYMLALDSRRQSYFVGIRTTAYRLAMIAGQGPLVMLAGWLEVYCGDIPQAWSTVFFVLSALFVILSAFHLFALPKPAADALRHVRSAREAIREFADTFRTFFTKPHIAAALLFMLFYKFPEAQLQRLITPFLQDPVSSGGMGLSTLQVGVTYGVIGLVGLMAGGIAGGFTVARGGLRRWMMPMAWSMSLTCLAFVWLSYSPSPSQLEIDLCVLLEQFGYGFGTTAYTLYLIYFSKGDRSTSYYAIATGIMSLGMMLPGMLAGWIQKCVGYGLFFVWTVLCCAVTIAVARAVTGHIESAPDLQE